jgi:hypothetical protein
VNGWTTALDDVGSTILLCEHGQNLPVMVA